MFTPHTTGSSSTAAQYSKRAHVVDSRHAGGGAGQLVMICDEIKQKVVGYSQILVLVWIW